jgi:RNA polymerase sigma-70 factor (ECF subfamily)
MEAIAAAGTALVDELVDEPGTPSPARPPVDLQLARWIRLAQEGDAEAFEELVGRHERCVYGTAWRLLGHLEDARDAAQEVFLRLYRSLARIDPGRPLQPWLYRVTVNVCRDLGRERRRRSRWSPSSVEELRGERGLEPEDPLAGPERRAEAAQETRRMLELLEELPDKERTALVLRDLEGLSTAEVAECLGSSPVTVRTQISRARLKLHRLRRRLHRRSASETPTRNESRRAP